MRIRPVYLSIAILTLLLASAPGHAQVSVGELTGKLTAARILEPGAKFDLIRHGDQILFDGTLDSNLSEKTKRSLAFAIASVILHADAGATRSVVTRFRNASHPGSFQDIVVTGKEVVGVDAGIEGRAQAVDKLHLVNLDDAESPAIRAVKYVRFAQEMLEEDNPYEAEHLFQDAVAMSPDTAASDPRILKGLCELARSFDLREDFDAAGRTYRQLSALVERNPEGLSLNGLRQMARFYRDRSDFAMARDTARRIVEVGGKTPLASRKGYGADLRFLAFCNLKLNDIAQAKKDLEQALLFVRNVEGESHPEVAQTLEDLGDCYAAEGNKNQALSFYTQAKERFDRSMAANPKGHEQRVEYEIYNGAVGRLKKKIGLTDR
ncbi:MAG: tetratricopeptide repeat protein [Cyanobacteria bacterium HKST-UBA02]|nr:tetratricopeptide repeat protein [Cyanobacteria bacterium HKST-UBA02]